MKRSVLVLAALFLGACEAKMVFLPGDMAMTVVGPDLALPPWSVVSTVAASDFAIAGATVYLAGADGVQRSNDGGQTFGAAVALPFAVGEDRTAVIAVDPFNAQVLYVGLPQSGILKSSDGGASFTAINSGLDKDVATGFYPPILAFGLAGGESFAGTTSFLFRSIDGGQNWTRTAASGGYHRAILMSTGQRLVGTIDAVLRSSDGGTSFMTSTSATRMGGVIALALAGTKVLAVTTNGFYRSMDGAATFSRKDVDGATFAGNVTGRAGLAVDFPDTVYLAPSRGVFRSSDGGDSFADVSAQLAGRKVYKVAVDTADSTLVWALGEDGLLQKRFPR